MNTLIVKIKGKNIANYIYKIHLKNINILNIKYISKNEAVLKIYEEDYDILLLNKGIYEVSIIKYKGLTNFKKQIKYHKYILISLFIGCILFITLSNIIYDIEIVYSGSEIRSLLTSELKKHGIYKYSFVKKYDELNEITKEILSSNSEKIEWLTIERIGTKYVINLEPRTINSDTKDDKIYDIVSKKDAIIKKIEASSGEIIKEVNDYVKKGDIIISSNILLFDEVKKSTPARGKVYGETWYKVKIEYPLHYYEEKYTGNTKEVYNIKLFNKYIGFSPYKNKKVEDHYILKNVILPISLNKQLQKEFEIIDYNLGYGEAKMKALEEARKNINQKLSKEEYIMDEKSLKYEIKDSKIIVDIFYTIYEEIGEYKEIEVNDDIQ